MNFFSPARLVLDIAEVQLNESIDLAAIIPENTFATIKVDTLKDKSPSITRFEITLAESHTYKVDRIENDLSIRLFPQDSVSKAPPQTDKEATSVTIPVLHDIVVRKMIHKQKSSFRRIPRLKISDRTLLPDVMALQIPCILISITSMGLSW